MTTDGEELIGKVLAGTVEELDIPIPLLRLLNDLYLDVGAWLDTNLEEGVWRFFPQGSWRLGTITRPSPGDEFDLDAVICRSILRDGITKEQLVVDVGDALQKYEALDTAPITLEEIKRGRRCWTLLFKEPLHMDVLPAIPDDEPDRQTGLLITDKDFRNWLPSDPEGYARWFYGQMTAYVTEQRTAFAKSASVMVDDVPEWFVRTPLQRVVQVLKAHRNCYFSNDLSVRPPSIVITTLAAMAFEPGANLYASVMGTASGLLDGLERDGDQYVLVNPAQPREDFADRMNNTDFKRLARWVDDLQRSLEAGVNVRSGFGDLTEVFQKSFNAEAVKSAIGKVLGETRESQNAGTLSVAGGIGTVGAASGIRDFGHTYHS